jgi:GNAT superfamily N-acetyltransferase
MAWSIEPLAAYHVREDFNCGEAALDDFLRRLAGQQQRRGFGKTYVALADDGETVAGFVTVSAGQLAMDSLPPTMKLPRYPVPVLRIGRLAVDARFQGQGVGKALLRSTLGLALELSEHIGLYAVVVEAKHEKAKAFYERWGFMACIDAPFRLYLPLATLRRSLSR